MNFKENESLTKLRGGYYTEPQIASFLLSWVLKKKPKTLLEPSCGDGVFFRCLKNLEHQSLESVLAFEIEPDEAEKARGFAKEITGVKAEVLTTDFIGWSLLHYFSAQSFDAIAGNPPFIRYQYLDHDLQITFKNIFDHFHLPFTMHTNAWVPFVITSLAMLNPGGRLAMVLPEELLHILHASSLRKYLAQVCSRILIIDPQELWFENTLQGAILLLAEKKETQNAPCKGVGIIPTRTKAFLDEDPETFFSQAIYANGDTAEGKWMTALLSPSERAIYKESKTRRGVHSFTELAEVAVGIVTGANKFFLVPDAIVEKYQLNDWAYPMFGRSEHVPGVIFDEEVLTENKRLGLPTNFLWFTDEKLEELPQAVQKYLQEGEQEGLHTRYKCRIRTPWYSVPSVYPTNVGMLKRSHDFPRLILNKVQAYTTDTAYRLKTKGVPASSLVFSFVNPLTALSAELEGRHYGGGVLELVPSEIRKLIIPIQQVAEARVVELDELFRAGIGAESLLAVQSKNVLEPVGFTKQECEELLNAWNKLRVRRHRNEISKPEAIEPE